MACLRREKRHRGEKNAIYGEPVTSTCDVCGKEVLVSQSRSSNLAAVLLGVLFGALMLVILVMERCDLHM